MEFDFGVRYGIYYYKKEEEFGFSIVKDWCLYTYGYSRVTVNFMDHKSQIRSK